MILFVGLDTSFECISLNFSFTILFLPIIIEVRPALHFLLDVFDALEDGCINLILLLLGFNQPLIETPHGFYQSQGSDLLPPPIKFCLSITFLFKGPWELSTQTILL